MPDPDRTDEYVECKNFDWDNVPEDYTNPHHWFWYILQGRVDDAYRGFTVSWPDGDQSWEIKCVPTSDCTGFSTYRGDVQFFVNGVSVEKELRSQPHYIVHYYRIHLRVNH